MSPARSVLNDALPPRVSGCRTPQSVMPWRHHGQQGFAVSVRARSPLGTRRPLGTRSRPLGLQRPPGPAGPDHDLRAGQPTGIRRLSCVPAAGADPLGADEAGAAGSPLLASAPPFFPAEYRYEWPSRTSDPRGANARCPAVPGPSPASGCRSPCPSRCAAAVRTAPAAVGLPVLAGRRRSACVAAESFSRRVRVPPAELLLVASELAFVMALVEVGGAWTAVARAAAVGHRCCCARVTRARRSSSTSAVVVVEVCVAVGAAAAAAGRRHRRRRRPGWLLPRRRARGAARWAPCSSPPPSALTPGLPRPGAVGRLFLPGRCSSARSSVARRPVDPAAGQRHRVGLAAHHPARSSPWRCCTAASPP